MKKNAGIIVLIVLFVYSAVKGLDVLLRSGASADYYIFATNDLTPLFFIYAIAAFILDALTVYFLFRPRSFGFYTALSSLALSFVYGVATFFLVLADLPGVKNAYAAGREARGLPVRRETLEMLFTPAAWGIVWAATVLFLAVIAFLVIRNRRYFFFNESET